MLELRPRLPQERWQRAQRVLRDLPDRGILRGSQLYAFLLPLLPWWVLSSFGLANDAQTWIKLSTLERVLVQLRRWHLSQVLR